MVEKRKYEVIHRIRFERRKSLRVGAVVELDAQQAAEFAHAIKLVPTGEQTMMTSDEEQALQAKNAPSEADAVEAATEDGAEGRGVPDDAVTDEVNAGTTTSEEQEDLPPRITDGARQEAARLGISLDHVRATGMNNTLTKKDVQREAKRIRVERGE